MKMHLELKEALVNAVYHKSYEEASPIEIRINQNDITIVSHPGPLPPLNKDNLNSEMVISRRYRNSRIGDFLKELDLTEGRNTGFSKIRRKLKQNGSSKPIFKTDDDRVYFITQIKIHPDFKGVQVGVQVELIKTDITILINLKSHRDESRNDIIKHLGYNTITRNVRNSLNKLLNNNLIQLTIPDKPNSPKQKYRITEKGLRLLNNNN